MRMQIEDLC